MEIIYLPKPASNTFCHFTKIPFLASPTNLHELCFLPQPLLVPLYHLDAFLPEEAMMKGGGTPFFFSGQQIPPSLSASFSPLSFPEHPRLSPAFAHAPSSCQTQVDARGRGKTADAGQSRALERLAGHPTVDAASPDHLEPPPRASRCPSTSAPRQQAAHLLPRPPLSPAARARAPPRSANARATPVARVQLAPLLLSLPATLDHSHEHPRALHSLSNGHPSRSRGHP